MTDIESITERIHKLLRKAERTDNQHEAEAFTAAAQRLMTQYAIQVSIGRVNEKRVLGEPVTKKFQIATTWFLPTVHLVGGIAEANDCQIYYNSPRGRRMGSVTVVGFPEDLENVELLYLSILAQLQGFTRGLRDPNPWGSDSSYKRSFRYGFAYGIRDRLMAARNQVVEEVQEYEGSLLPALIEKKDAVNAAMPDNLGKGRSGSVRSPDGVRAGVAAAERADVGSPSVGGRREIGAS